MSEVHFTPTARRDLANIVETIAIDNPKAAIAFETQLEHHCSLLAITPAMGQMRPEVGPASDPSLRETI